MLISWNNKGFKPKFSEVYSNYNSFIADECKHGRHLHYFSNIFYSFKLYEGVNYSKYLLKKIFFPTTLVDNCIKIFLKNQFVQKIVEHNVPKEELFTVLLFGMSSLCLGTGLQKSINSKISFVKLKPFLHHQHD